MLSGGVHTDASSVFGHATPPRVKLSPEQIERLRETGIRIDREGRLWHDGDPIEHQGLRRALLRWLDILPDGRPILRLDDSRYAYVEIDDAFLLVTSARWESGRVYIHLNDDTEEELDYDTLSIGHDDAMYCRVRGGKLRARVTTKAYYTLAENIHATDDGYVLAAANREYPLRSEKALS